jgi:hypothetical protein
MVVVAEKPATDLVDTLGKAGAFPLVECRWADAPEAVGEIQPAALAIAHPGPAADPRHVEALQKRIEAKGSLFLPVLARVDAASDPALVGALPIASDAPGDRLLARLRSALRVRTLHATVTRRARAGGDKSAPPLPAGDPLDDATVLCMGRGRFYPALSVAVGENVNMVGALSVETAARLLNARDIDGVVIGDGFGPRVVEALLTVLAEDARFRDLPVGVLGGFVPNDLMLPNLIHVASDPQRLVRLLLPLVRVQAFEMRLKRALKSLESEGTVDAETGLFGREAFWRDLGRAVHQAEDGGSSLSVARFTFEELTERRARVDAARMFSRLVRDVDFACQVEDGAILAAFTETDLRSAHVIARRIASVLRHTMLSADDKAALRPTVTLATLKPSDNLSTLVARIGAYPTVAAG